jgi:hypothetical protein
MTNRQFKFALVALARDGAAPQLLATRVQPRNDHLLGPSAEHDVPSVGMPHGPVAVMKPLASQPGSETADEQQYTKGHGFGVFSGASVIRVPE